MGGDDVDEQLGAGDVLDIEGEIAHLVVAGMEDVERRLTDVIDEGYEFLVALARGGVMDRLDLG